MNPKIAQKEGQSKLKKKKKKKKKKLRIYKTLCKSYLMNVGITKSARTI